MKPITITAKITNRDNDSLKQYFRDIYNYPKFTPQEEADCAERAFNGDKDAFDELIHRNLRFVVSIAKDYETKDCPLGDLINEGNLGLIKAAKRFKPDMGFKFISYGVWWIRKHINEYQTNLGRTVRIPSNKVMNNGKLNRKLSLLEQKLARPVDLEDLISEYGNEISDDEIKSAKIMSSFSMDSLDRDVSTEGDGGATLADMLNDNSHYISTDSLINQSDVVNHVKRLIDTLKPREQEIIISIFGLDGNEPQTLAEIGDRYGLTRESIRLTKEKILVRLRKASKHNSTSIEI